MTYVLDAIKEYQRQGGEDKGAVVVSPKTKHELERSENIASLVTFPVRVDFTIPDGVIYVMSEGDYAKSKIGSAKMMEEWRGQ